MVAVPQLGGGVEMEERSCVGLAPSTARDAAVPIELRVTERSAREAVEAEGAAIAEDAVRAMEGPPPQPRGPACGGGHRTLLTSNGSTTRAASAFWKTGGSDTGYTEIGNNLIARCPVQLRLFRTAERRGVEVNGGVLDANGTRIESMRRRREGGAEGGGRAALLVGAVGVPEPACMARLHACGGH